MSMIESIAHAAWICGAAGAIALLVYGGWLVWLFQANASVSDQQTVARLALHESLGPARLVDEIKLKPLFIDAPVISGPDEVFAIYAEMRASSEKPERQREAV
jgi:hypothetical protein